MCKMLGTVLFLCASFSLVYCRSICDIANCIHGACILDNQQSYGFRCDCDIGYTGSFCERSCTPSDTGCTVVTQPPICVSESCVNGQCSNSSSDISECICYEGWTGTNCEIDINYCEINGGSLSFFGPCDDLGSVLCVDGNNTYTCECLIGFTGRNCETGINECILNPNPCSGHGSCIDGHFASYSCNCDPGFTGPTCETVIPPCDSSPCLNQGTCQNTFNGIFKCDCPSGFSGILCETNELILMCASQLTPCLNGGTCQDTPGSNSTCFCREGYFGSTCSFQNCSTEVCKNGGKCVQNDTSPFCECSSRFEGAYCERDRCENITCLNGGTCFVTDDNPQRFCQCMSTFTGPSCEVDSCGNLTCPDGEPCSSMNNTCTCPNDMPCKGGNASFHNFTCALSMPCLNGGTCQEENDGIFRCLCTKGYFGRTCSFQNCTSTFCSNGGTCTESDPRPYCECSPQYQGTRCEIDRCENITCLNGGLCNSSELSVELQCQCNETFSGRNCEMDSCAGFVCHSGENCMNINGTCACSNGESCTMNSTKCTSETCQNGGSCRTSNESLLCLCNADYGGEFCQDQLCTEDTCAKICSCIEVSSEFGKRPLCQCPVTTVALRIPVDRLNPILIAFVILLTVAVLMSFIIATILVIFFFGCRKSKRKHKKGNNVTIHAEYHSNPVHLCEDNISVDVDQHRIIVNESIGNANTHSEVDILSNSNHLELVNMNLNDLKADEESISPKKDQESEVTELQNVNIIFQSSDEENIFPAPTSDLFEDNDINSINLAYVDSDQEQSEIENSEVFIVTKLNCRQGENQSVTKNAHVGSSSLSHNGPSDNESVHENFSFQVSNDYKRPDHVHADLEQDHLSEAMQNKHVYNTTRNYNAQR